MLERRTTFRPPRAATIKRAVSESTLGRSRMARAFEYDDIRYQTSVGRVLRVRARRFLRCSTVACPGLNYARLAVGRSTPSKLGPASRRRVLAVSWCLWKSVKYWGQRLYQQHGTSAQHTGTHHKQGQDTLPKNLDAGDVIRIWHLCTRFVRVTKTS